MIAALALVGCDGGESVSSRTTAAEALLDKSQRCSSTAHDRFDFLVGAWSLAYENEEPFAEFELEESVDNCTLHGFGRYTNGEARTFFGFYDSSARRWKQAWISSGFLLELQEPSDAEGGQLAGTLYVPSVALEPMPARLTLELQTNGTIRERMPFSVDGGASWTEVAPIIWSRKATP